MNVTIKNIPNYPMPQSVIEMLTEITKEQPNGFLKVNLENPGYSAEAGGVRPHYLFINKTDSEIEIEEFGNLTYIPNQAGEYELAICDKWDFVNDIGCVEMIYRFNIKTEDGIESLELNLNNIGAYYELEYLPETAVTVLSCTEAA
ncbi:hypothetical protein [Vibrio sp. 10N.239.312.D08]|uniref:hypothetical protein n=1 Tax=Vibrio sp. 10N.239.312.D08 TaxID=3229978 RepID=UPI00354B2692